MDGCYALRLGMAVWSHAVPELADCNGVLLSSHHFVGTRLMIRYAILNLPQQQHSAGLLYHTRN